MTIARLVPALFALAAPAAAQDLTLALPIDCTLGETCHIQQYVDRDPGPGVRDWTCGPLAYDGHQGTDFALPTRAAMDAGVAILAPAPGVVQGVRDGMPDIAQGTEGAPALDGRDCGNGVLIAHPGGWETQLCHMALGSISVAPGDEVETGDVLGRVGLSGNTQFPHVHLSVRRDGAVVDPFAPVTAESCGATGPTLWAETPAYEAGGILDAGFAVGVPDYEAIKAGAARTPLGREAPMVLFALMFGGQDGDVVRFTILGPNGREVFAHEEVLDRTQAQFFRAAGRRSPDEGWALGQYWGELELVRAGEVIDRIAVSAPVD